MSKAISGLGCDFRFTHFDEYGDDVRNVTRPQAIDVDLLDSGAEIE